LQRSAKLLLYSGPLAAILNPSRFTDQQANSEFSEGSYPVSCGIVQIIFYKSIYYYHVHIYNIVTCLGTSDTNLSRVRLSVTSNYCSCGLNEASNIKFDVFTACSHFCRVKYVTCPDFRFNCQHLDFMIRGFFYSLCNLVGTFHESHINHFNYETQTRSSTSVCLVL
jgi:hypothetical protein